MPTETFSYTGSEQTWTVPDGIESINVTLDGASGGDASLDGGGGGHVDGWLSVTPGETLYLYVGGQGEDPGQTEGASGAGGWNGGGDGGTGATDQPGGTGGGGGTDIRQGGNTTSDRVVVAGGGGGDAGYNGGDGGGTTGGRGGFDGDDADDGEGGYGGSQTSGGAGGAGASGEPDGNDGALHAGGNGPDTGATHGPGGGGGGYYGGGSGGGGNSSGSSGAGGGGSSYVDGLSSVSTNSKGANNGNGQIVIEYDSAVSAPTNVSVDYAGSEEVTLSFDGDSNADQYDVEIRRDEGSWLVPQGGPATITDDGSASYSATYTASPDSPYGTVVGKDSKIELRVRATNDSSTSSWAADTSYTRPIAPTWASAAWQADGTIDLTWQNESDVMDLSSSTRGIDVFYKKEDGSDSFGSWTKADSVAATATDYTVGGQSWYEEHTRYKFKLSYYMHIPDYGYVHSPDVRADFDNPTHIAFSDMFEGGDLSNWDSQSLSYAESGVRDTPSSHAQTAAGVSDADEGDYLLELRGDDWVEKKLGDLSAYSDVYVNVRLAVGDIDVESDAVQVWWSGDGGSSWTALGGSGWEMNRNGWRDLYLEIDDADLGTNCVLSLQGDTSNDGDDVALFDAPMVQTQPTALMDETQPTLDNGVEDEIGIDWGPAGVLNFGEYQVNYRRDSNAAWGGHESFEDMSVWTTNYGSQVSDRVYDGDNAYYASGDGTGIAATWTPYSGGGKPKKLSWVMQESSDSYGAGVRLKNSNGNYECGFAFDNPEWDIEDGNGFRQVQDRSSTYDRWVRFEITFHWNADAFDVSIEDQQDGTTYSESGIPLMNGTDLATIELRNYHSFSWDAGAIDHWWDDVQLDTTLVDAPATSHTRTGLPDGEGYDVRLRTTTAYSTGTWTDLANIVTKFPGASSLGVQATTDDSADLAWTDNADNEDGFRVEERHQFDSETWSAWDVKQDLAPNTTATTMDVLPGRTYEWRIEAYTEHTTGTSNTVSATTDEGATTSRKTIPSQGWYAELTHSSGETITPTIVAEPSYNPRLNDLPEIHVPVTKDDRWTSAGFEQAAMEVWLDGERLPIDELSRVEQRPSHSVLVGHGGMDLRQRVQVNYQQKDAHVAAEEIITANTSYTANVDDPAATTTSDTLMQEADTTAEFDAELASSIPADTPLRIDSGYLETTPVAGFTEAENASGSTNTTVSESGASAGEAAELLDISHYVTDSFSLNHQVPDGDYAVSFRYKMIDGSQTTPGIYINFDGTEIRNTTTNWSTIDDQFVWSNAYPTGPIAAGSHSMEVGISEAGDNGMYIDAIAIVDQRHTDVGDTLTNGYLDDPDLYPPSVQQLFAEKTPNQKVVAGKLSVSIDNTENSQQLGLTNDGGDTWQTASNTSTLDTSFGSDGTTIQGRVTLSNYGSRTTQAPTTGYQGQAIDVYEMYADLDDTPILTSKYYDDQIRNVLSAIAEYGNFIWQVQYDADSGYSIEWTQPGQRTADRSDTVADFETKKRYEEMYEKIVVRGSSRHITSHDMSVSADSWYDIAGFADLVEGSESVHQDSTTYEIGSDYEMDYQDGRFKALSSGDIDTSSPVTIDFSYKTIGSYTMSDAGSDPDTRVVSIPSATSTAECDQLALNIAKKVDQPRVEATITIPKTLANQSLVDDVKFEGVPTDDTRVEIQEMTQTPEKVVLKLGSRREMEEIIQDLEQTVQALSNQS